MSYLAIKPIHGFLGRSSCVILVQSMAVIGLAPRAIIPVSKDGQRGGKADIKSYIDGVAYDRSGAQRFLKWPWVHALA